LAGVGERRVAYRVLVGKHERERDHLEDPDIVTAPETHCSLLLDW